MQHATTDRPHPLRPTRVAPNLRHGEMRRAYELGAILVRYGWHDLAERLGVGRLGRRLGHAPLARPAAEPQEDERPARLRRALEEMGPTFVKLGQILATRSDLFAPPWIREFERLQNAVPAAPPDEVLAQLREDLGAAPESVFAAFDRVPMAAASIAQVHAARLPDGREVVVKIRRPGIRPRIEADLRLLRRAAQAVATHFPEWRDFQPLAIVEQLRTSLLGELDLAAECRHAERIAAALPRELRVVVPKVHWRYTSERVNVQDRVLGIPVTDVDALDAAGVDRAGLARRGARAILHMMLHEGFFHADPHRGNVFALPDGAIALIDFGMVGRLTARRRVQVLALLHGLVARDAESVSEVLCSWAGGLDLDEEALVGDIATFIDAYHGVPLAQLDLAGMLLQVTSVLRSHHIVLPADLALMIKVCLTLEGMGRALDGSFDMASEAAPFLRRELRSLYSPRHLGRQSALVLASLVDIATSLPADLRRTVRSVRTGRMRLRLELHELDTVAQRLDRSANRLTIGIVIAALVVGSSITMTVQGGPTLLGLPLFGLLGFIGAVVSGTWLVASIWSSGGGR